MHDFGRDMVRMEHFFDSNHAICLLFGEISRRGPPQSHKSTEAFPPRYGLGSPQGRYEYGMEQA